MLQDLVKDLESELSGDFKETILSLMMPPAELDAYTLNKAMKGLGTNEGVLVGILCSKSGSELSGIKTTYKKGKYYIVEVIALYCLHGFRNIIWRQMSFMQIQLKTKMLCLKQGHTLTYETNRTGKTETHGWT